MTAKKLAICPYCGELLSKRLKSIDHIIPKQIGGAGSFKIISCQNCNTEIGKIEQRAMSTVTICNLLAEMGESGFRIKTRRKRDYIPLQKSIGLAGRTPVKFYYSSKTHKKELHFLSPPNEELMALIREKGTFYMLSDYETGDSEKDEAALVSLASKIVLGTCVWLWGDDFSNTKHATNLRNLMRDVKVEKILKMDSSEKHLELPDDRGKDALDNQPHHSILIGKLSENIVVGLINLFGSFESMMVIGSYDDKFRNWIGDSVVVVISKTTTNQVLKMTWEKYESFKSNAKKLNRIGNSLHVG
jgi:hypothetical protein